jgi:hypothetical protein
MNATISSMAPPSDELPVILRAAAQLEQADHWSAVLDGAASDEQGQDPEREPRIAQRPGTGV